MKAPTKKVVRGAVLVVLLMCLVFAVIVIAGGDVRVNQDLEPLLQNETSITVNRATPGNVVVGYNDSPGSGWGLGISYSFNYGAIWFDTQTPTVWGVEADPAVASDLLNNIFAGYISYALTGPRVFPSNGIYVSRSTDGGVTWALPATVDQYVAGTVPAYFTDKDYITVDQHTTSPYTNRVYVTWQRDNANGVNADIFFAWSANTGATFIYANGTPMGRISDLASTPGSPPVPSSNANGPVPAVAPTGDVYVAWQDAPLCIQSPGRIYVDKSTDGGQNFSADVVAANYNTCARWPKGGQSFQVRSFPCIAVSPVVNPLGDHDVYIVYAEDPDRGPDISIESDTPGSNSSTLPEIACEGSYVYAVWTDYRNGAGNGDIYFNRSADNGLTWGTDRRVNTNTPAGAAGVQTPRIAVDSASVHVLWEDRRNGNPDIYYNYSADYGVTWLSSDIRLDTGTIPGAANAWAPQIGADGGNVFAVWTDDRSGDADILCNYSTDGGATWQSSPVRVDNATSGVWANQPKLSWEGSNVYVTWYDARNGWSDIFFNTSPDGGQNWQSTDAQLDTQVGVSADPCITSGTGHVYVAWWDQRNGQQDIYFNYSYNNGASWLLSDIRLDTGDPPGASTADLVQLACQDTMVYAVWSDSRNGLADVYYNYSSDHGANWQLSDQRIDADYVAGNHNSTNPRISVQPGFVYIVYEDDRHGNQDIYFRYSLNNGATWYLRDIRLDTGDYCGANGSGAPRMVSTGNNVYAVWHDWRNGLSDIYFNSSANNGISWRDGPDDGDIMLVRSFDGGATWDTPRRVNDDATTRGQFQPWIDVKPNGVIDVVWYDRRNDVNDSWLEVYMGTSGNRGWSFTNTVVSDVSFGPPPAPTVWPWPWIGEYMGIDVDSTYAYIAWTDTRTGDLDIFFDRFLNPTATGASAGPAVPEADYLSQSFPNPFNPTTTIAFGLKETSFVSLRIYDVSGKLVRVLVEGKRPARHYEENWDGRDNNGERVASGVYFCRLTAGEFKQTRKMVLLK